MSGDIQVELWLNEYKAEALSSALEKQGTSIEERLQEMLIDLYSDLVPYEVQQTIRNRIDEERAAWETEQEASRQYTAFRAVEHGAAFFFQVDGEESLLNVGKFLRRYLQEGQEPPVAALQAAFARLEPATAEQYDRLAALRMENPQKVPGVFDLNFDRQEVSTMDAAGGWRSYSMKDVSIAVYYACRKNHISPEQHRVRFLDRLAGREIIPARTAVTARGGKKKGGDAR